jgi:hypothetical protein
MLLAFATRLAARIRGCTRGRGRDRSAGARARRDHAVARDGRDRRPRAHDVGGARAPAGLQRLPRGDGGAAVARAAHAGGGGALLARQPARARAARGGAQLRRARRARAWTGSRASSRAFRRQRRLDAPAGAREQRSASTSRGGRRACRGLSRAYAARVQVHVRAGPGLDEGCPTLRASSSTSWWRTPRLRARDAHPRALEAPAAAVPRGGERAGPPLPRPAARASSTRW